MYGASSSKWDKPTVRMLREAATNAVMKRKVAPYATSEILQILSTILPEVGDIQKVELVKLL
eukprot:1923411-Amphidinium_carterae.1